MQDMVEQPSQQIGQAGQAQWDLIGHGHQVPEAQECWAAMVQSE